jgi:hypothetical protein
MPLTLQRELPAFQTWKFPIFLKGHFAIFLDPDSQQYTRGCEVPIFLKCHFANLLDPDFLSNTHHRLISNVQGGDAGLGRSRSQLLHRIHPAWRLEAGTSHPRTTAQPLPAQVRRRPKVLQFSL